MLRPFLRAWHRRQYKRNIRRYWTVRDFMKDTLDSPERAAIHHRETRFITERVLELAPRRVLDVGCSFGAVVKSLAERGVPTVVGIDLSPLGVAQAQRFVGPLPNAHLLEASATALPFPSNSFDAVITRSVMSILPPDVADAARRELVRVCRGTVLHLENETSAGERAHSFPHNNAAAYHAMGFHEVVREPGPVRHNSTFTLAVVGAPAWVDVPHPTQVPIRARRSGERV